MLLPILSLPTKEIVREHTPPKPKRSKENDSSENSTQEMEKETVDKGHMDEPNDVSISSDDDDEVGGVCSRRISLVGRDKIGSNIFLCTVTFLERLCSGVRT
jgi:hypothetical protein